MVGAFLLIMARNLFNISREQFPKKEMPNTVRQTINFVIYFTIAFIFLTVVMVLGLLDTVRNEFNPTEWNSYQYVLYTITYTVYDIIAVGILVRMHHKNFKACSLESMQGFMNSCLLGAHFMKEIDIERTSVAETEQDINNGGKFKSVLIDVNRTRTTNSKYKWSTFDTDNMQHICETEIDENEHEDKYADIYDLDKRTSKGFPGTQPEQSNSPWAFGHMDIANNFT